MVAERKELGPMAYPLLKIVYGATGFVDGVIGGGIGFGLGVVSVLINEGLFFLVGGAPLLDQNSFLVPGIVLGAAGFALGSSTGVPSALTEFHRDFTKRPRRTRR